MCKINRYITYYEYKYCIYHCGKLTKLNMNINNIIDKHGQCLKGSRKDAETLRREI